MLAATLAPWLHRRGIHYGWVMVAVTFLTAVCTSAAVSLPGVLLLPISTEFGWLRADISGATALMFVMIGTMAPFAGAINGSVWSLRYEIVVYVLLIAASLSGALARPWRRAAFLALLLAGVMAGYAAAPHAKGGVLYVVAEGRHVLFSFLLGVAAHQFAGRIPLHPVVALPGIALTVAGTALGQAMLTETGVIWLTCAATLLLAFPAGPCRKLPHDISYGIYIYSWPLQQLVVFLAATRLGIALSPIALFLIVLGPLIMIALASWEWIEKPALALAAPHTSRIDRS